MSDSLILSLFGLWFSGFLSATLLPGNSELAFLAFLKVFPNWAISAFIAVSIGNTLGSLSSYLVGRCVPQRRQIAPKTLALIQRWGSPVLFLSWVPVIGDALPLAAGWLRLPTFSVMVWISVGKITRYLAIWWGWSLF